MTAMATPEEMPPSSVSMAGEVCKVQSRSAASNLALLTLFGRVLTSCRATARAGEDSRTLSDGS